MLNEAPARLDRGRPTRAQCMNYLIAFGTEEEAVMSISSALCCRVTTMIQGALPPQLCKLCSPKTR